MGKSSSPPPAPDPTIAAEKTAAANRVNQYTPYGSLTYSQDGGSFDQAGYDAAVQNSGRMGGGSVDRSAFQTPGAWSQHVNLSPEQQALLNQQNKTSADLGSMQDQMIGQVRNSMGQEITQDSLPQVGEMNMQGLPQVDALSRDNLPQIQGDYAKTGYDAIMSRLNPELDRGRAAFDTQMANQGITAGSEAYNNAYRNQSQGENDARIQAGLQGIGIGQQQQNQQMALQNNEMAQRQGLFNSQMANQGQQYNQRRGLLDSQIQRQNQAFNIRTAIGDRPMNRLNALRTGAQVTNPSFGTTAKGADYSGAQAEQNKYNMGLYNADVASNNSTTGAVAGMAGTAMMAVAF
jgi:hypothetical protein